MSKKKVLIVTQEMNPYTEEHIIDEISRQLPQIVQDGGLEVRILMPRFGMINERRHRLHEVVRLSGMNIIVDDDDYPLIIKVASLPGMRLQVYFLDNDDFFRRKNLYTEEDGTPFEDNADRMVFFCKGVLETVKKFGWAPDIIHCHGWMTSLLPLYLKTAYLNEPVFQHAKVVYSVYNDSLEASFNDQFVSKASINNLEQSDLSAFQNGVGVTLHQGAMAYAEALIDGSEELPESVLASLNSMDKPRLSFQDVAENDRAFLEFYETLLEEKVEG